MIFSTSYPPRYFQTNPASKFGRFRNPIPTTCHNFSWAFSLTNLSSEATTKISEACNHQPSTINHHQPSSTIINHHQPSSTIINHRQPCLFSKVQRLVIVDPVDPSWGPQLDPDWHDCPEGLVACMVWGLTTWWFQPLRKI